MGVVLFDRKVGGMSNEHPARPGHFIRTVSADDDRVICVSQTHATKADQFACGFTAVWAGATVMISDPHDNKWSGIEVEEETVKVIHSQYRREASFAFKHDAERWAADQLALGFQESGVCGYATQYFGPTDAQSNCWLATVERTEFEVQS